MSLLWMLQNIAISIQLGDIAIAIAIDVVVLRCADKYGIANHIRGELWLWTGLNQAVVALKWPD